MTPMITRGGHTLNIIGQNVLKRITLSSLERNLKGLYKHSSFIDSFGGSVYKVIDLGMLNKRKDVNIQGNSKESGAFLFVEVLSRCLRIESLVWSWEAAA